ncbi:chromosome segregation protein SMC [Listeria sp. PSOL-1]|uniref:chromosome segregation protein SMC n=1 Tax=Listeria sp. PSOL-1 TaxID=1844999 RepID=UPI0013CF7615|nr:chromosome segregation protein SMC [Listeria sp. PSOL-1]
MLLKRLEMNGFKSFADKVAIDFVPGMTAVVGPNGSGKSNITEAIRWVLGEQSAKSLRGGRMGDVIFAGSDTRKQVNFAEVSLILENEDRFLPVDYSEVSVARRIYRNGDSEFLINKQSCRLKDIVDLFMETGVGREAFSIISQGKIDEILNSKPEERRTIFEEAAGVLKYKGRKKQAENKLFETEENLNRVSDILHELEAQHEPLEMQASIAKDYLYQQKELEKYEVTLIVREMEQFTQELNQKQQVFDENQTALLQMREQMHAEENKISQKKHLLSETDYTLEELQATLLKLTENLEQLEGERNLVLERKKHGNENEQALTEALAMLTTKIAAFEAQKKELEAVRMEKEIKLEVSKKAQIELEKKLARYDALSEEAIENKKSDYIEIRHEQTTVHNDIGYIERELIQMNDRAEKMQLENRELIAERNETKETALATKKHLEVLQQELQEQIEIFSEVKAVLEKKNDAFEQEERALYRHYEKVQQLKSRKETLAELADDYAGFFQGVREVLKAKDHLKGVLGAFIELINIPENYQTAIEITLGASAQNIVTNDAESARSAISFLKEKRAGRATFLPLSTIQSRELPANIRQALENEPAFIAVASDVISFEAKITPIVTSILGTTILAKDLKGAGALAKLVNYRYRVVTLEGDVVNAFGSMTGGATKQGKSSIISRKNELEQLTQTLSALEQKTLPLERGLQKAKESLHLKRAELEETRAVGENLRVKEQELVGKETREKETLERLNKQLELYDFEKANEENERSQLEKQKAELEEKKQALSKALEQTDKEITEMVSESKALESKLDRDQTALSELKAVIAVQKEQLQTAKQDVLRVEESLMEQDEQKEANEKRYSDLKQQLTNTDVNENETKIAIEKIRLAKEQAQEQLELTRNKRSDLKQELQQLEDALTQKSNQASFYLEQKNQAEIKIGKIEVDLKNRTERLADYSLTRKEASEKCVPELTIAESLSKVRLLKRSIEELGAVNLGAIEEFERVDERFRFLTNQQTDLLEAKENLFKVMEEMDEEMKKRFALTFSAIKEQFALVFPELFGGGKAELVLLEPENLLTTGIDIIVQPPGKKLQNLSLRSGGERALTAIALLFAIIRVRPVPFCILDEVEAALDEANVIRFSRYLKQFESKTQFIVITHRKGTMEEADVLYGVTMQESGVSKLVSVRLEETAKLIK